MSQTSAIVGSAGSVLLIGTGATYTFTLPPNNINNFFGTLAVNDPGGTVSLALTYGVSIGSVAGINGVTAGTLNLSFAIGQGVSQTQPITVNNLSLSGGGTNTQTLTNTSNSIGTLAASGGANGTINLYDSAPLVIGSVNSINGVTAVALNLGFANGIGVTQTQAITATNGTSLSLSGNGGTYTLTNTSNDIATFAASVGTSDTISLYDSVALAIGTVNSINGVTAGTLNLSFASGKGVTQSQAISVADLSLSGSGTNTDTLIPTNGSNSIGTFAANVGSSGTISLTDSGNLAIGSVNSINGVTAGTLTLTDTGTVTQTNQVAVTNLALLGSGGTYTLTGPTTGSNSVGTLAANTGSVSFTNSIALTIGTVGSTIGITATGAVTVTTTGASSTIAITGPISDPTGTLTLNSADSSAGSITDTSSVNVAGFTLAGGNWSQNYSSLTVANGAANAFSATNFVISGGTFLRTVGSGENGTTVPYQIFDVYGLQGVTGFLGSNFTLAQNINASGTSTWNPQGGGVYAGFAPIGGTNYYGGTFNGANYTISNLYINLPSGGYVGLFGGVSGTVENVNLTSANVTGAAIFGMLAGANFGTISNSTAGGTLSASGTYGAYASSYEGGLVGYSTGTVSSSSTSGTVTGVSTNTVGGLVGFNYGGTVTASSSSASVDGVAAGGLVGGNQNSGSTSGSIINSFTRARNWHLRYRWLGRWTIKAAPLPRHGLPARSRCPIAAPRAPAVWSALIRLVRHEYRRLHYLLLRDRQCDRLHGLRQ